MIETRHLRHLLALAEHRNYARAADALHLTQPALTRSIQALEASLDAQLFDRGRGEVTPKPSAICCWITRVTGC